MLVKVRSFLLLPDVYPSTYLLQFFVLFIFSIFLFFFSFCTLGNVLMVPHFVLRIDSANNRGYKVCFYRLCLDLESMMDLMVEFNSARNRVSKVSQMRARCPH